MSLALPAPLSPTPPLRRWITYPRPEACALFLACPSQEAMGPKTVTVVCSCLKAEAKDCSLLCPAEGQSPQIVSIAVCPIEEALAKDSLLLCPAQRARATD